MLQMLSQRTAEAAEYLLNCLPAHYSEMTEYILNICQRNWGYWKNIQRQNFM